MLRHEDVFGRGDHVQNELMVGPITITKHMIESLKCGAHRGLT